MSRQSQSRKWGVESVKALFKKYYERGVVRPPEDMVKREFAVQLFEMESYVRHLSFQSEEALRRFLAERAPKHIYYSIALYHLPDAKSMEEKGWIGSEIMVDIDVDHLERCSALTHDECLMEGLKEAIKAKRVLERDFGMETTSYFSGSRGFHIIARGEEYMTLGRQEREEIARYLAAQDLELKLLFPPKKAAPPSREDPGWRGWLASWGDLDTSPEKIGIKIDAQVTRDPSRLARPLGSLNGKSGLMVVRAEAFRPDLSLSPFAGELTVRALRAVDDTMLSKRVLLREGETATLEAPLAILLYLKGYAEVLGGEARVV